MRNLAELEEKLLEIETAEEEIILHGVAYVAGIPFEKGKEEDARKLQELKSLYEKKIKEICNKEMTAEDCNYYIRLYLEAEQAVLAGQEYTIDGQNMRRADLDKIRKGRIWWENKKEQIENNTTGIQVFQICPNEF